MRQAGPGNAWVRYARQISLLGEEGQKKLLDTSVAVVGLGGLGSVVSLYLAAAGVGRLILVDHDEVEIHNLNRQLLYGEADVGLPKAYIASRRLREIRLDVEVVPIPWRLDESSAAEIVDGADIVVDALDNWEARLALADAAWDAGKPLVHAAVERFYGQLTTIEPGKTMCLHCLAPSSASGRRCVQVVGPAVGVVASLEALEVIKIATGLGEPLYNKILVIDTLTPSLDVVEVEPTPCDACRARARASNN